MKKSFTSLTMVAIVILSLFGSSKSQEASSHNKESLLPVGGSRFLPQKMMMMMMGGKGKEKGKVDDYYLETIQVGKSDAVTTLRDDGTEGLGDVFTWDRSNNIYATTNLDRLNSHTLIGDNQGHCIRLTNAGDNSEWDCFFTVFLKDGQLHAHGPFNAGVTQVAITGGTGAYKGATGSMELSYAGEVDGVFAYNYIFHLY